MNENGFTQFSTLTVLLLLAAFYGGTYLLTLLIRKDKEDTSGFMVAGHHVGFGMGAASMTATWIWAASFYAAATSGYTYGVSGPIHYGLWGALMILFIYPFGRRFRKLAPNGHTLGELIHARHGASSQMILAISNILGSVISLMVNFTAAGALVSVLSPLSFETGVIVAGVGVLAYTLTSGFRASVFTDFAQLVALMAIAIIIIPAVLFSAGGPSVMVEGLSRLTGMWEGAGSGLWFSTRSVSPRRASARRYSAHEVRSHRAAATTRSLLMKNPKSEFPNPKQIPGIFHYVFCLLSLSPECRRVPIPEGARLDAATTYLGRRRLGGRRVGFSSSGSCC